MIRLLKKNRFDQAIADIRNPATKAVVQNAFDNLGMCHDWLHDSGLKFTVQDLISLAEHLNKKLP